jgi:hypothetical protein
MGLDWLLRGYGYSEWESNRWEVGLGPLEIGVGEGWRLDQLVFGYRYFVEILEN